MKILKILAILIFNFNLVNAGFFDLLPFGKSKNNEKLIITGGLQEKQHLLSVIKKEKDLLYADEKQFTEEIQKDINQIAQQTTDIKNKLIEAKIKDREFLNKILSKLNELSQLLIDTQLLRKRILDTLEQHIEILENYINNSNFKGISITQKASYNFEDLKKLTKDISRQEEELAAFSENKNGLENLIENNRKDLIDIDKQLKSKERDQKEFSGKVKFSDEEGRISIRQKGEILDLDVKLLHAKKKYLTLSIKESNYKISLNNTEAFISESILKILKEDLIYLENSLWITDFDLDNSEKELANKKRESIDLQSKYTQEISNLSEEKDHLRQKFENINKNYNIHLNDLRSLDDWSIDPNIVNFEPGLYELGYINSQILTLEREISLKDAQRELEKNTLGSQEISANLLESWNKISQHKLRTEENVNNERKKYLNIKLELEKELIKYKEKINIITNILNNQTRSLSNLKETIRRLKNRQNQFVSHYSQGQFDSSITFLTKSEEQVVLQNEYNNKLLETYSNLVSVLKSSLKDLDPIILKLSNVVGVLQRSEYAITWTNIKNIIPDLKLFISDLKNVTSTFFSRENLELVVSQIFNVSTLISLFLQILLLILLFFLLKKLLPSIFQILLSIKPANASLRFVNFLLAVIVGFVSLNLLTIFIWSLLFVLIKINFLNDLGFLVIFNLLSIIYLCYLAHKFIKFLIQFNISNNYVLLNDSFQRRFTQIFLIFAYSTIVLLFFREAFASITYGKSELPTILLALYSIIFRASLIFLIGKEEILSIIPTKSSFWIWIRNKIDNYYYLLLTIVIILMIISDPYIGGFNRLVSFILWSSILTILLITGLWWLQIFLKRASSFLFFSTEDDEVKERFAHSKTLYGISIIFAFLLFLFIAIFVGARIWHLPVSPEKITEAFNLHIFYVPGDNGQSTPITLGSFITIFSFLFFGFIIAWAFNRFILNRIFNLLLIETGVQNTVSSISYYFIIIVILLVGLLRVGLNSLIPFLVGAIAVGLAFAIKGPANDFIGYFIILLERSVKIGDYLELDSEVRGVVRKITPRSVILRRKNSVSIIVPNSKLTNSAFCNWDYSPGFFAFNDIIITIPFNVDPGKVISIFSQVLDENANVLKRPAPIIRLDDFSESGYVFMVRGFLSSVNVLNQWDIMSDIRLSIIKKLSENNIKTAYPVRKVFLTQLDEENPRFHEKLEKKHE